MSSGDFVHEERVRFRDLDPMGHVNNAVFLTYIEQARTMLIEPEGEAKQVVLILGDTYTMWDAGTFKTWAQRLMDQL